MAQIHALTANRGRARGRQIISPEGLEPIFDVQSDGIDKVIPVHIKFGMGFGLPSRVMPLPNARTCFWAGWGGSMVIIDMELNMTVSYVMNRMATGVSCTRLVTSPTAYTLSTLDLLYSSTTIAR